MSSASQPDLKLIKGALGIYTLTMDHEAFVGCVRNNCGRIPPHIWNVVCDRRKGHEEKANQLCVMLSQLVQQRGAQVNQKGKGPNVAAAANSGGGKGSGKGKAKGGNAEGGHANGNGHVQFVQNFGQFKPLTSKGPPKKKRCRRGSGGNSHCLPPDHNARVMSYDDAVRDMAMMKRAGAQADTFAYIYDKPKEDRRRDRDRADRREVDDRAAHKKLDNGGDGGFAGWAPGPYRPRGW